MVDYCRWILLLQEVDEKMVWRKGGKDCDKTLGRRHL